jgi:hypothetical protein
VLINNQAPNGRHELKGGDLITAGSLILEFRLEEAAADDGPMAPSDAQAYSGIDSWM